MNKYSILAVTMGMLSLWGLTSCVDDNYDLDNVDTTVRVPVKDLVIPVNIDKIELSSIIDLKEDDQIKVVNGVYAASETGTFNSSAIKIDEISLAGPSVAPTENEIHAFDSANSPRLKAAQISYRLHSDPTVFKYQTNSVSEFIKSIDGVHCDMQVKISMTLPNLDQVIKSCTIDGLSFQLPKGLTCSTNVAGSKYDPSTGILEVGKYKLTGSGFTFILSASYIDAKNNDQFSFNSSTGGLDYNGSLSVLSGTATITEDDLAPSIDIAHLPTSTLMGMRYDFSDIRVTTFTGEIEYPLEDVNVSDVMLDNLPDVLSQPETNISLANPQIFLSINNPLNDYNVYAQAGMTITPMRGDVTGTPCSIDGNGRFEIGKPHHSSDIYNFLLSPTAEGAMTMEGYDNPMHVAYSSLSDILAGEGLPDKLKISLNSPMMPRQKVTDFRLGSDLGIVEGSYHFVAPLQFKNGSTVVYTDTQSGWNDETLNDITIQALSIDLNITSELPLSCELTGYPIDVNGNQINNVTIEGATIPAMADGKELTIRITGEINNLDGVYFKAVAKAENDKTALSPDLTITLNKVRPHVTGYYEKEL